MPDNEGQTKCLIDTSVLANIQNAHADSEAIWEAVIAEVTRGHLKTVRHVMDELERRFSKIFERPHPYREVLLIPDDILYSASVVAEVRIIQQQHPQLYRALGGGNSADPFLIAVAKELGVVVATDEKRDGHHHRRRIPWVCAQRKVGCIDRMTFLKDIGYDV